MKKTKPENESPFRNPKPKKKLGLKVPTIRMPHEDLIKPEFPKLAEVPPSISEGASNNEPGLKSDPPAIIEPASNIQPGANNTPAAKIEAGSKSTRRPLQNEPGSLFTPGSNIEGAYGYSSVNNFVSDKVLRLLGTKEQVVLIRLLRLSHGFGKNTCKVSVPSLEAACNLTSNPVRSALKTLESLGLIKRGATDSTNHNNLDRGMYFEILLSPPSKFRPPSNSEPGAKSEGIKDKRNLKENNKRPAHLDVGKSDYEEREILSLDEQGRFRALEYLIEFKDDLDSFKRYYTEEDWNWLIDEVQKS